MIDRKKLAMAIRIKRGMDSFKTASVHAGISDATLCRLENEQQVPDADTFAKLCDWIGVPMDYFKERQELAPAA